MPHDLAMNLSAFVESSCESRFSPRPRSSMLPSGPGCCLTENSKAHYASACFPLWPQQPLWSSNSPEQTKASGDFGGHVHGCSGVHGIVSTVAALYGEGTSFTLGTRLCRVRWKGSGGWSEFW